MVLSLRKEILQAYIRVHLYMIKRNKSTKICFPKSKDRGWGDSSLCPMFATQTWGCEFESPANHKNWVWCGVPVIPALGRGDRKISGACRPTNLVTQWAPVSGRDLVSKNKVVSSRGRNLLLTSGLHVSSLGVQNVLTLHTCTHTCTHTGRDSTYSWGRGRTFFQGRQTRGFC